MPNLPPSLCDDERRDTVEDRVAAIMIKRTVDEAVAKHQSDMITHIDAKFGQLDTLFKSAFPNGDPVGHRLAHEGQIKSAEFWSRIKISLAEKLAFGVVSGGLLFIGLAAWEALKTKLGAK